MTRNKVARYKVSPCNNLMDSSEHCRTSKLHIRGLRLVDRLQQILAYSSQESISKVCDILEEGKIRPEAALKLDDGLGLRIMNEIAKQLEITGEQVLNRLWDEARASAKGPDGKYLDTNASARIRALEGLARYLRLQGFVSDGLVQTNSITIEYVSSDEWRGKRLLEETDSVAELPETKSLPDEIPPSLELADAECEVEQ